MAPFGAKFVTRTHDAFRTAESCVLYGQLTGGDHEAFVVCSLVLLNHVESKEESGGPLYYRMLITELIFSAPEKRSTA